MFSTEHLHINSRISKYFWRFQLIIKRFLFCLMSVSSVFKYCACDVGVLIYRLFKRHFLYFKSFFYPWYIFGIFVAKFNNILLILHCCFFVLILLVFIIVFLHFMWYTYFCVSGKDFLFYCLLVIRNLTELLTLYNNVEYLLIYWCLSYHALYN